MTRVAVLGAGSWGTTLANLLARKGEEVSLWAYEPEVVETVRAIGEVAEAVSGVEVIVSAPPSHAVRGVIRNLGEAVPPGTLVVSASTWGPEPPADACGGSGDG